MRGSERVSVDRLLEGRLSEEDYVDTSASLIYKLHDKSQEWRTMVREEENPRDVRRKARQVAKVAKTLETLQEHYRTPHAVSQSPRGREKFDGDDSEILVKSNLALSYVNDLGTSEFYEFDEPEDIDEGEFCVWNGADERYITPSEVLDEMPDNYTEGMLRLNFSGGLDELPDFEKYSTFPEI